MIYEVGSRCPAAADIAGLSWISSSRRRNQWLNKIRKRSTAGEITELLNRDMDLDDRPFQAKDVAEWLRNTEDTALTLYWSRARPRK
jgi:hypothetical protein